MYILCIASLGAVIKDYFEANACHLTQRCVAAFGSPDGLDVGCFPLWKTLIVGRRVANLIKVDVKLFRPPGKNLVICKTLSPVCYWSVSESVMPSLSHQLGLSATAISQSVERGELIATVVNFSFDD
jgi:hypothetical protein